MGWYDAKQLAALGSNVSSWANVVKPINLGAMRSFNRAGIKSEAFGVALAHGADDAHNAGADRAKAMGFEAHRAGLQSYNFIKRSIR
jgi:hypothetical protein